jgi:tetratricopeptide (TPR) repeat protein
MIVYMSVCAQPQPPTRRSARRFRKSVLHRLLIGAFLLAPPVWGQTSQPDWQTQVRRYSEKKDWASAMRIVEEEIARAPGDVDVRAWRARVLEWSGNLAEAEREYLQILQIANKDPDNWMGLGNVYLREGKTQEASRALDTAIGLDPRRADLRMAHGRALAAAGDLRSARLEFQRAISLDPANKEVRVAQRSVFSEPKNELTVGQEDNAFNFLYPNYDESLSLQTQWTPHWSTTFVGNFFQWGPAHAGKFQASVGGQLPKWGGLTVGGATGHDSGVIPKTEAFFELDHGWKISETRFTRGLELTYEQHWYWYNDAKVQALAGVALIYLPRDWTFSIGVSEARSTFPGLGTQWRPSETARLEFPIIAREQKALAGNIFFATGTENFASIDQIGSFASQTYGGGLKFAITARQSIGPYASYQKRSQNRTDTNFGLNYGLRF